MNQTEALRTLTAQMYAHTSAAQRASQCTARAQSETFVRKAPVQRLAPAEQQERLSRVMQSIANDYLNGPMPVSQVREKLSKWEGAFVR